MTAHDQMRAMLDQLMGTARNGPPPQTSTNTSSEKTIPFTSPSVCRAFLLSCCPHEVLASTRMDLGDCPLLHNVALRTDYEIASEHKEFGYDVEALQTLSHFIADADRKTASAAARLISNKSDLPAGAAALAEKTAQLSESINQLLTKAEALGAAGSVEESVKTMEKVDELRQEKVLADAEYRAQIPAGVFQQQKLRVCDVCCAYLGIGDNDRRLADHFGGKLHLGFIRLREAEGRLKARIDARRRDKHKSSDDKQHKHKRLDDERDDRKRRK